jgi:hypothetical protein
MQVVSAKDSKNKIYIAVIVVLAAALGYALLSGFGFGITGNAVSQDSATQKIKDIYKILTDKDVEILSMKAESGIYKVVIRTTDYAGAPIVQDIFITTDGKFITDKLLDAEQYRASLSNSKDFITCLSGKGVRVVGQSNNNYTLAQMQLLGSFGYRIYFDCIGDNIQTCQQLGIKTIPSVIYNQTIYEGIKPVEWFEQLTNCTLQK